MTAVRGVNTNTLLRVLRELLDEGDARVPSWTRYPGSRTPERGAVVQRARELVVCARRQGHRTDELIEIIEDVA